MFTIDTGLTHEPDALAFRIDRAQAIRDGILDSLAPDHTPQQYAAAAVATILGYLHGPKTRATVRRRFCDVWPILKDIALADPEGFDEIIVDYAERITELPI